MSLTTTTRHATGTGNGVTTDFSFPIKFLDKDHLDVYIDDVLQAIDTDYTVAGEGAEAGGTVTFLSAPSGGPPAESILIIRVTPNEQPSDWIANARFNSQDIEDELDRQRMIEIDTKPTYQTNAGTPEASVTGYSDRGDFCYDSTNSILYHKSSGLGTNTGWEKVTDISDLDLGDMGDVTLTSIADGEVLRWDGSGWVNNTLAELGASAVGHVHATSDITSGTFADARIAESNVTQHEAALTVTESQISDLQGYVLPDGSVPFTSAVEFPDGAAAAPAVTNTGDTDTGLYWDSANSLSVATDGAVRATFNAFGHFMPGTTGAYDMGSLLNEWRNLYFGQGTLNGYFDFKENAAPTTPSSGYGRLYAKTDGKVYWKDDTGTETDLTESGSATVTSVAQTVPTGFTISGSPVTTSGTLAVGFDTGYSLPTNASQANWDTAYGWGDHASGGYLSDITSENLSDLSDVTITSIASGEILKWNGSAWVNNTLAEAGIGTGDGTVTSVAATVPTGFTISGSPITSSGTLALDFDIGYALPPISTQTNWDTAYGWGDHAGAGYLADIVSDTTPQLGGDLDYNGNDIVDATGNTVLNFATGGASSVNHISVANNTTGNAPGLIANGTDANVDLELTPKGAGWATLLGVNLVDISTPQTLTNKTLGATTLSGDLNAGSQDITALDNLQFDTSPTTPLTAEGSVYWDATNHTVAIHNDESDVTMQVGQELYIRVRNESGGTITNGEAVYQSGTETGGEERPLITEAQANSQSTAGVIGIATHDIENNTYGYISAFGVINDLDTSSFSAGDPLYLSADTAGALVNSEPVAPNYSIQVGSVITSHATTGNILVAIVSNASAPTGDASELVVQARKGSAGTITAGQVVYQSGWHSGSGTMQVELADMNSSSTMPAIGIARESITNSSNGAVVLSGKLTGIDTSSFSAGDALYVSGTAGSMTATRPTAATDEVQKIALCLRSHASNGVIEIVGAGRSNDGPNKHTTDWFRIADKTDTTKLVGFDMSGITAATTRTYTLPDLDGKLMPTPTSGTTYSATGTVADSDIFRRCQILSGANDLVMTLPSGGSAGDVITFYCLATTGSVQFNAGATPIYHSSLKEHTCSFYHSGGQWLSLVAFMETTTKGDLILGTTKGPKQLAVGTNDYALVADSTADEGVAYVDLASRTETLTNKTIDADSSTISNIGASEIKSDIVTGQTTAAAFGSGDKFLIVSGGALEQADYDDLPGAGGGISNVVEDTTPQAGGDVDMNSFNLQFDDNHGIQDDSGNWQLLFSKATTAVNYFDLYNAATGSNVKLASAGTDATVNIEIDAKGGGTTIFPSLGGIRASVLESYTDTTDYIDFSTSGQIDFAIGGTVEMTLDAIAGLDLPNGNLVVQTGDIESSSGTVKGTDFANLNTPTEDRLLIWQTVGLDPVLTETSINPADVITTSDAATTSASGIVELATAAETTTGTDTTRALTADGLAGSDYGKTVVSILVSDPNGDAITTGDGKAYWRVPDTIDTYVPVAVAAAVTTASSSGIPTVQIHNVTQAGDMLTTKLTIDASETDSSTAATAAVIDPLVNVRTGDMLRIDIDVSGTGTKGLIVELTFQRP